MSLKEKLARLDKGSSGRELPQLNSDQTSDVWIEDFQKEFGAKIIRENSSMIIIKETLSSLDNYPFHPGCRDLNYFIPNFHHLFRDDWTRDFNLRDTLFIDLETTGLSGGTAEE